MQYPQVTKTQVELWLQDPTTQAHFKSLELYQEQIRDHISSGACLDRTNADLTLSRLSEFNGQLEALEAASGFENLLNAYGLIEEVSHVQAV